MPRTGWKQVAKRIRVPLGFLFAVVFLVFARPTLVSLAWSLLPVLGGLALRAYASGYVKKNAELTTSGPYAWTRNPLYLGSMLIAFGFAGSARSPLLALLLAVLFAIIYVPVIAGEEEYLRAHFAGFEAYARAVPRLLPWKVAPRPAQESRGQFSAPLYRKHREYNSLMGAAALYLELLLRIWFAHGHL